MTTANRQSLRTPLSRIAIKEVHRRVTQLVGVSFVHTICYVYTGPAEYLSGQILRPL